MASCMYMISNILRKVNQTGLGTSLVIRNASKKTGGSTQNTGKSGRPKHRGWKVRSGETVTRGTLLALQYDIRFCPGLNVGYGKRGQVYAKVDGKVYVTCEKTNLDRNHGIVKKWYPDVLPIYKKYYNVIPEPQHQRFKLIDQI